MVNDVDRQAMQRRPNDTNKSITQKTWNRGSRHQRQEDAIDAKTKTFDDDLKKQGNNIMLEPDMTVIDLLADNSDIETAVRSTRPDAIITRHATIEEPAEHATWLFDGQSFKIIAAHSLVAAIRAAARRTQ